MTTTIVDPRKKLRNTTNIQIYIQPAYVGFQ